MKRIFFAFLFIRSVFMHAQSELFVTCNAGTDFISTAYTMVQLDTHIVEYNYCGLHPSFFISIFDDTCAAWGTDYFPGSGYDLGQVNTGCRTRKEYHFQYFQDSLSSLVSLDSLINNLPPDFAFTIYTPLSFDYNAVNLLYPQLGTTLVNNWGTAVEDAAMIILFGIKGDPSSYQVVASAGEDINLSATIACAPSQNLSSGDQGARVNLTAFPNPTNGMITISSSSGESFYYQITDIYGREIISKTCASQSTGVDLGTQPTGMYLVIISDENGTQITRRIIRQ